MNYKISLIIFATILLSGCNPPTQVDSKSVELCLSKGWVPKYNSTGSVVQFECKPLKSN